MCNITHTTWLCLTPLSATNCCRICLFTVCDFGWFWNFANHCNMQMALLMPNTALTSLGKFRSCKQGFHPHQAQLSRLVQSGDQCDGSEAYGSQVAKETLFWAISSSREEQPLYRTHKMLTNYIVHSLCDIPKLSRLLPSGLHASADGWHAEHSATSNPNNQKTIPESRPKAA